MEIEATASSSLDFFIFTPKIDILVITFELRNVDISFGFVLLV